MRILQVIPYMHRDAGGPPVVVRNFHEYMRMQGINATVLTGSWGYNNKEETKIALNSENIDCFIENIRWSHLLMRTGRQRLKAIFKDHDLVILHTLWNPLVSVSARILRKLNIPFYIMTHGMLDPSSIDRKKIKKLFYLSLVEKYSISHARKLLFTTEMEKELSFRSLGSQKEYAIVTLGVKLEPAKADYVRHDRLKVIFLGRLHEKKGPDILIRTVQQLRDNNIAVNLTLIGNGDDEYIAELKSMLRDCDAHNIVMENALYDDDKTHALQDADVFVLPSHQENFALVVAEAMSSGLPVIVSDKVNTWPLVNEAHAGFVIRHNVMHQDLALALQKYVDRPELLEEHGRNAARYAVTRFSLSRSGNELMRALEL